MRSHFVGVVLLACLMAACSGGDDASQPGAIDAPSYNTGSDTNPGVLCGFEQVDREFEPVIRTTDTYRLRGRLTISHHDRGAHELRVEVIKHLAKGDEDTEVIIADDTMNTVTSFTYSDEDASATVAVDSNRLVPVTMNADDTVNVDGSNYADVESASDALTQSPDLAAVSPETVAALNVALDASSDIVDTAKLRTLCRWITKLVCQWGCRLLNQQLPNGQISVQVQCGTTCSYVSNKVCN